jgi:hypothetical protein
MIPLLFEIVVELSKKYCCHMVRLSDERLFFPEQGWYPSYYLLPWANGNILKKCLLSRFAKSNKKKLGGIRIADHLFGILHSGRMDVRNLRYILRSLKPGITEILTHPSISIDDHQPHSRQMKEWLKSHGRVLEMNALIDDDLCQEIKSFGIELVRYQDIISNM